MYLNVYVPMLQCEAEIDRRVRDAKLVA